jgi:hypothetical protein
VSEPVHGPAAAFYARRGGRAADWWTLLHPPYTLWHLSHVVIGATLAPTLRWDGLLLALTAFLLAVGVAAHALDELQGRPLQTGIRDRTLWLVAALSLSGAVLAGVVGVVYVEPWLALAIPVGVLLVLGYNLELFGGRLHTDVGFALSWGGFPVVVGLLLQSPPLTVGLVAAAVAATAAAVLLASAQRRLSTPARTLRRKTSRVGGELVLRAGGTRKLDQETLLAPLEGTLRALCWAVPLLALALLLVRVN